MSRPIIRPITRDDVDAVVDLLRREHWAELPVERARAIVLHDWPVERPNYGFLLESDGRVVGCIVAAFSERQIRGRTERFCNIGTWYVEPEYRAHSLPLSWKLGALKGYTFTALTANPTSEALFRRGGYRVLASDYHMFLPGQGARGTRAFGTRAFGASVVGGARAVEPELDPADRQILRDHLPYACNHFLLTARGEDRYAYVVTKRWKYWHRDLVPVSEILYVSDKALAARHFERLKLGILLRDRSLVLATERRFLGDDAPLGKVVVRPRFFRSETLEAADIDNLYSEAVLL
jgi:acetoacetyl-CoA synthetase